MALKSCDSDSNVCVQCVTVAVSEIELLDIVKGVVVHLKGFTHGLQHSPPEELVDYLLTCDVVVFDGDSFKPDAFTCVLPILAAQAHTRDVRVPDFVAFKYASGTAALASWSSLYSVTLHPSLSSRISTTVSAPAVLAKIHVVMLDASHDLRGPADVISRGDKYLNLGVHALFTTGAKLVVCLGGGATLTAEFEADRERKSTWHVFDAARLTRTGEIEHCSLLGNDSPRIVHHRPE
jgi:hypothetical protein